MLRTAHPAPRITAVQTLDGAKAVPAGRPYAGRMPDALPPSADLDLFLVRCFTVLAEHRHFGRAAVALHVTQSSLSRQISRLEQQLGARLVDRTPQGSRLTEAGEVFLPLAKAVLRSAGQAAARARAAARPSRITVGHTANLIITPAIRELRFRHPDADVQTLHEAGLCWAPIGLLLDSFAGGRNV
jgi:Bacterial regulatory helix-turn-helix protein, lysR family